MGDACSVDAHEYDDPFDAMGRSNAGNGVAAVRQMSMEHKLELNLLPATAVKVVGAPGTFQIAPMETLTGSVQVLRLPKPGGGSYFVEYRRPIGFFDGQPPDITGVLIRTESPQIYSEPVEPERRHRVDRHASRDRRERLAVVGCGDEPRSGLQRPAARHHHPERRAGRGRCDPAGHGAARRGAAERAHGPLGGRERHVRGPAMDGRHGRLLRRQLRRRARRRPGRHAAHDGVHRHPARARDDGRLHRRGGRCGRQRRARRERQRGDPRPDAAWRAAQGRGAS